jgi:uncharacterized membrane protein HdeD (DUF308 family)
VAGRVLTTVPGALPSPGREGGVMLDRLAQHWWVVVLRGVLAILFGIIALVWPGITILALVLVFGAYALVDGVLALVAAFMRRDISGTDRAWLVVQGIAGIAVAAIVAFWPGITALILLVLIALWLLLSGAFQIASAIALRRQLRNEWLLLLTGILSIIAGIILIVRPGVGALAVVWVIGIYAIVIGILQILLGFRLRGLAGRRLRPA